MTREEIRDIYLSVCDIFPNFKPKNPQATFNTWVEHLSKYTPGEVKKALDDFIENNPGGYAPNVSNLIPKRDEGGFRGRTYTAEEFKEMERAGLQWLDT